MGILDKLASVFKRTEAGKTPYELFYPAPQDYIPGLEIGFELGEYALENPFKANYSWRATLRQTLPDILKDFEDWKKALDKLAHLPPRNKSATLMICAPMSGGPYKKIKEEEIVDKINKLRAKLSEASPSYRRKLERKIRALEALLERIRRGEIPEEMRYSKFSCIVLHKYYGSRKIGIDVREYDLDSLLSEYTKENVEVVVARKNESPSSLFARIFGAIENLAGGGAAAAPTTAAPATATAPATPAPAPAAVATATAR